MHTGGARSGLFASDCTYCALKGLVCKHGARSGLFASKYTGCALKGLVCKQKCIQVVHVVVCLQAIVHTVH